MMTSASESKSLNICGAATNTWSDRHSRQSMMQSQRGHLDELVPLLLRNTAVDAQNVQWARLRRFATAALASNWHTDALSLDDPLPTPPHSHTHWSLPPRILPIAPHHGRTRSTLSVRTLWEKMQVRSWSWVAMRMMDTHTFALVLLAAKPATRAHMPHRCLITPPLSTATALGHTPHSTYQGCSLRTAAQPKRTYGKPQVRLHLRIPHRQHRGPQQLPSSQHRSQETTQVAGHGVLHSVTWCGRCRRRRA